MAQKTEDDICDKMADGKQDDVDGKTLSNDAMNNGHISPPLESVPNGDIANRHESDTEEEVQEAVGGVSCDEENNQSAEHDESEEESDQDTPQFAVLRRRRLSSMDLPDTVTTLTTNEGSRVYVVGTAHFSESSQQDVIKTIQATQPDIVLVELCSSRVNILQLDEETLLHEAKNINFEKIQTAIKQAGFVQGIMHLLLLSMSAHLTKQLGMAPGGEFRKAFQEANKIPGCKIHLGDRPIQVTLQRALGSLTPWQKARLAWYMLTSKDPISKEEVEKCKQKDLLEEMLREMTGEFPALSRVFVTERDIYLSNSLRISAHPIPNEDAPGGHIPSVVVGVVGIGHVPGIVENWEKIHDMKKLMTVPEGSMVGTVVRKSIKAAIGVLFAISVYKVYKWTTPLVTMAYTFTSDTISNATTSTTT